MRWLLIVFVKTHKKRSLTKWSTNHKQSTEWILPHMLHQECGSQKHTTTKQQQTVMIISILLTPYE